MTVTSNHGKPHKRDVSHVAEFIDRYCVDTILDFYKDQKNVDLFMAWLKTEETKKSDYATL